MENEYRPKNSDSLWLGSKGRYGSFHLWINVCVADPSLTRAIPERPKGELLIIKRYTNRHFTLLTTTTTVLRPFVRDYPGEPVPEETLNHPPS